MIFTLNFKYINSINCILHKPAPWIQKQHFTTNQTTTQIVFFFLFFLIFFLVFLFYVCGWLTCVYVCAPYACMQCPVPVPVPPKPSRARRGRRELWDWNYRGLWAVPWPLGIEPKSSAKAASALTQGANSPAPSSGIFKASFWGTEASFVLLTLPVKKSTDQAICKQLVSKWLS